MYCTLCIHILFISLSDKKQLNHTTSPKITDTKKMVIAILRERQRRKKNSFEYSVGRQFFKCLFLSLSGDDIMVTCNAEQMSSIVSDKQTQTDDGKQMCVYMVWFGWHGIDDCCMIKSVLRFTSYKFHIQ